MKKHLCLFLIILLPISKGLSQPSNLNIDGIEILEAIPTKRIACDYHMVSELQNSKKSSVKNYLNGIWGSDEYKETLFKTNSITKTLDEFRFYTDIIFDQDSTLHCNRPNFMEEDYFTLINDSTFVNLFDKNDTMMIVSADNQKLVVRDNQGKHHSFTKMKEDVDLKSIYSEVTIGSEAIENLWLKGKWNFKRRQKNCTISIGDDGKIISSAWIQYIVVHSYEGKDILMFDHFKNDTRMFVIESHSGTEMHLREIKPIEEVDQPIEYLNRRAVMRRIP